MASWMFVEDEMDMYDMLFSLTETLGHQGLAFPTAPEAFAWLDDYDAGRIREEPPLLALIDVRLGDYRGEDVAARLRRSPKLHTIPIIMISAYFPVVENPKLIMERSGANLWMPKPLPDFGEFKRIVNNLLQQP